MARPADPTRRATILRAATEVFIERGFSDARLSDIAARAGVVVSTLYLYFDSKEAMVSAIAGENQRRLVDELRPALEQLHGEADVARVVATVRAFAAASHDAIRVFNLDSELSAVRGGCGPRGAAQAPGSGDHRGVDQGWLSACVRSRLYAGDADHDTVRSRQVMHILASYPHPLWKARCIGAQAAWHAANAGASRCWSGRLSTRCEPPGGWIKPGNRWTTTPGCA